MLQLIIHHWLDESVEFRDERIEVEGDVLSRDNLLPNEFNVDQVVSG